MTSWPTRPIVSDSAPSPGRRGASAGDEAETLSSLLAAIANGDVSALATLYDCTGARLYGVAVRVQRDPEAAQETVEATFLQVWATAQDFDSATSSPQAWLTTLAHRRAVERVRSERGRTARILGCSNGNRVGGCHYVIDEAMHHMESADGGSMNDWQRESIALAYYGGFTYREVSDFLGVPVPTVKSRIKAGMTRLRAAHASTAPL